MSVEKLSDISKVLVEQLPFTQIPNNVIKHIKDNDAFRLYCYLISKSRDWHVVKEYAAKECGIGEKKARQCWSYFARCGLIEYRVEKDEKGKIIKHDMVVLIGLKFDESVPFKPVDKPTEAKTASVAKTHRGKNPPSGQPTRVDFAPLLNKNITNKEKETKQREPARIKRVPLSADFVFNDENRSLCKEKKLNEKEVLVKFIAYYKNHKEPNYPESWQDKAHLWILREKITVNESKPNQEMRCIVPDYVPDEQTQRASMETVNAHMGKIKQLLSRKIINGKATSRENQRAR